MPKTKLSPASRVKEFPGEELIVKDSKLTCSFCNTELDFEKKSSIQEHCKGLKHQKVRSSAAGTPTIPTVVTENILDKQWSELVSAFVKAGIPLNVLGNEDLRTWIKKYVKNGLNFPSSITLRRKLDPLAETDHQTTIKLCEGKDVCLTVDESTDVKARKVLNILVKPLGSLTQSRLIMTKFLDKVNANSIVQHVIKAMQSIQVDLDALVVFCSDNAPYMVKAGENLKAVCPRLTHSTCWAHVLHLTSEEIRDDMPEADELVGTIKKALIKSPARKTQFLECMANHGTNPCLPPVPVLIRWTTWLQTASFHWTHFRALEDWIQNSTEKSVVMTKLKNCLAKLPGQLERIGQVYPGLSQAIKVLEGSNVVASQVWYSLELVQRYLVTLGIPSQKLALYMKSKHPTLEFWKSVQILDPRKCPENLSVTGLPASLQQFSEEQVPFSELVSYQQLSTEEIRRISNTDASNGSSNNTNKSDLNVWDF